MHIYTDSDIADVRSRLLRAVTTADIHARDGESYERSLEKHRHEYELLKAEQEQLINCSNHMRDIYYNVKAYSEHHQQVAKDILNVAIQEAGQLVPDAMVQGIHLKYTNNNQVMIVDQHDQNVNLREGGGYRAVLGALLRYATIKAQPAALQLMLFDEYFFTLSDTTTQAMKEMFLAMSKDITIICIEQRRNAMDGIVDHTFVFKKDNDTTEVSKEE